MKAASFTMLAGGTLGAFALSAHFVGEAYGFPINGYLHDAAYALFVGGLPIGGWLGTYAA